MNHLLDHDTPHRLRDNHISILEALSDLGGFYLQARNKSGGLGKQVERLSIIVPEKPDPAFDPENGLKLSIDSIVAIHSGLAGCEPSSPPAMDFEFRNFPAGVSLHEFPELSNSGAILELTNRFHNRTLTAEELAEWRKEFTPCKKMCPCCERRAEGRVDKVQSHPLFSILEEAKDTATSLDVRLLSGHVDLTSTIVPESLASGDGFIILTGSEATAALHIDIRFLHAMAIDVEDLDSTSYSVLRLFDSYGTLNFQILCEDPTAAYRWRQICDASRGYFRA